MSNSELCACIITRFFCFVNRFSEKNFPKMAKNFQKPLYKTEKMCYNSHMKTKNGIIG